MFEQYTTLGFNYRLTDVQAAIGRAQLNSLAVRLEHRRTQAARYGELLADIPGMELPASPVHARTNWQSYCVQLPPDIDQRDVMQALLDDGIATRRGVMCAHLEAAYPRDTWSCGADPDCDRSGRPCPHLVNSETVQNRGVVLPMFDDLSAADQVRVADTLKRVCRRMARA